MLRTVKIQISEKLLRQLEDAARRRGTSRAAFARKTLQDALNFPEQAELEKKHRLGYRRKPVAPGEFDSWEAEQVWPD